MDEPKTVYVLECYQQLPNDALQVSKCEEGFLSAFPVELGELIKVVAQQLSNDDQVLLVINVVNELQASHVIDIVSVCVDDFQELDLIKRLVNEVLVILDDLHAHHFACLQVQTLDSA